MPTNAPSHFVATIAAAAVFIGCHESEGGAARAQPSDASVAWPAVDGGMPRAGARDGGAPSDAEPAESGDDARTGDVDAAEAGPDASVDAFNPNAPTWTYVFTTYLAPGSTLGHCGNSGCHDAIRSYVQCDTQSHCYATLTSTGYIRGTTSPIVDATQSMLSWYGGTMPKDDPVTSAPQATADLNDWVAAGAQDN